LAVLSRETDVERRINHSMEFSSLKIRRPKNEGEQDHTDQHDPNHMILSISVSAVGSKMRGHWDGYERMGRVVVLSAAVW
jgi:hypothetical protein